VSDRLVEFVKGHGTQNDFVVLLDPTSELDLTPARVRALCDRRRGMGADGVLRVVPTRLAGEVHAQHDVAEWFMDYRNADGSTAEMCGNGARVFSKVLLDRGLVAGESFTLATRGGPRDVRVVGDEFAVDMGAPLVREDAAHVDVALGGLHFAAVPVWFPNPHAVAFVDSLPALGAVLAPPTVSQAEVFPEGANFEFAVVHGENHVEFRVHERGAGETASCGTGACAVAWAYRQLADAAGVVSGPVTVDVPGGQLIATPLSEGRWELTGPVVIVAEGTIDSNWWDVSYE